MLLHGIIWCITFFLANGSLTGTLQKMYDDAMLNLQKFVGITTTKEPKLFGGYYETYKNPEKMKKGWQDLYKPGGPIRKPQVHDVSEDRRGCPPEPCYNPCVNPSPCCKQQCHTTKPPPVEVPWSQEEKPYYPHHPPSRDAPCLVKMYCNGQWKYMKGNPGIGTCSSLKCQQMKCDTKNLTQCYLILLGEQQTLECVGDGCTASCEGDLCKSSCEGSCCHARCFGRGCIARCRGSDCTTEENSRGSEVMRNGYPLQGASLARHHQICGSAMPYNTYNMARERKERKIVYFDVSLDTDDVGSLMGR